VGRHRPLGSSRADVQRPALLRHVPPTLVPPLGSAHGSVGLLLVAPSRSRASTTPPPMTPQRTGQFGSKRVYPLASSGGRHVSVKAPAQGLYGSDRAIKTAARTMTTAAAQTKRRSTTEAYADGSARPSADLAESLPPLGRSGVEAKRGPQTTRAHGVLIMRKLIATVFTNSRLPIPVTFR
jgi:hypothetical protein